MLYLCNSLEEQEIGKCEDLSRQDMNSCLRCFDKTFTFIRLFCNYEITSPKYCYPQVEKNRKIREAGPPCTETMLNRRQHLSMCLYLLSQILLSYQRYTPALLPCSSSRALLQAGLQRQHPAPPAQKLFVILGCRPRSAISHLNAFRVTQ